MSYHGLKAMFPVISYTLSSFHPFTLSPVRTPKVSHRGAPLLKIQKTYSSIFRFLTLKFALGISESISKQKKALKKPAKSDRVIKVKQEEESSETKTKQENEGCDVNEDFGELKSEEKEKEGDMDGDNKGIEDTFYKMATEFDF